MTAAWQLAQINVALPRAPIDSAELAEFVALLEPVNALADAAPGFVWRLQDDSGDATAIRAFGGSLMVNMSVWETVEALWEYVYESGHLDVMRRRREWFARLADLHMALWWVPAGAIPTVAEAEERLSLLRRLGPSPAAFTFKRRYPPPGSGAPGPVVDERDRCPAV